MSTFIKVFSIILGVLTILPGIGIMLSGNEDNVILGAFLILIGVFQCCLLRVIVSTYDMVEEIKNNNLPYIEDLVIYTKNQVKEIKGKMEDEEGDAV